MMDSESESQMELMARTLVEVAAIRFGRPPLRALRPVHAQRRQMGSVATDEGGHTVDSLMETFKSMARDALAFAIVVFIALKDGAVLFFLDASNTAAGHCVFGMANLQRRRRMATPTSADEVFAKGMPELFVVHH